MSAPIVSKSLSEKPMLLKLFTFGTEPALPDKTISSLDEIVAQGEERSTSNFARLVKQTPFRKTKSAEVRTGKSAQSS